VDAARLSLYEDAAAVASAAVKLIALDTAAAVGWVAALEAEIEDLAGAAAAAGRSGATAIPSRATPLLDRRAHAPRAGRLFAS
jgi:urease accessory protein UreF